MLQTISLLVENKPGALMRVTGVLSARGWNIDSLTVARTLDAAQSRMTIVVDIEPLLRRQVIKQMNKLVNVLQAADLTESLAVRREMALVRVRTTAENRAGILRDAEIYGARVVDATADGFGLVRALQDVERTRFHDPQSAMAGIIILKVGMIRRG
ncbi:acetolactate synthase small subunit, partial [Candidatus Deferrimicrobium sp.]|uniref:acetolactate synthase small subunit n=1 Tax=Candidatus Deferrimicrobium sp. TaxID=3060586 RepID=UPI002ED423C0